MLRIMDREYKKYFTASRNLYFPFSRHFYTNEIYTLKNVFMMLPIFEFPYLLNEVKY